MGDLNKPNINIGMLAHVDAGKTTLSEALLYKTGTIRKLGRVDTRDAFLDTNKQERARGITIFSKQAVVELEKARITLLDTPGHVDFSAEMERTLQVLDYAILVISGADGIQSHTETLWRLLARYKIPVFIFVNKTDQSGVNKQRILEQLKNQLSDAIIDFSIQDAIDMEELSLCNEELLNHFLENNTLDTALLKTCIEKRQVFPCFFGSALKLTGIDEFTAFRLWLCAEHHMNMVCIVIPFFQYDPVSGCDILKDLFCSFGYFVIQYFSSVFYNQGDNIAEILNWNYGLILLYLSLFFLYRLICIYELIVLFQYTISGDREQVFLWYYKDFFEQICSDVQFFSPPEGRH